MRKRYGTAAWLAVYSVVFAACSDGAGPVSPSAGTGAVASEGLFGGADEQAAVLERTVPLTEEESATRTIGPAGGLLILPRAGLTVVVPPLALSAPVAITVRAPAGDLVGYHFAPHGLEFDLPVQVTQDLTHTELPLLGGLLGLGLDAVYFEGALGPLVTVLETLPVLPSLGGTLGVFQLAHFSGYVIATN